MAGFKIFEIKPSHLTNFLAEIKKFVDKKKIKVYITYIKAKALWTLVQGALFLFIR